MTARHYAMISTQISSSQKMRRLPDNDHRLAYIYLHTSPLGSFAGTYRLVPSMLADELGVPLERCECVLDALAACGLIERDKAEGFVRICAWFLKENGPEGPTRAIGLLRDLRSPRSIVPRGDLRTHAITELALAAYRNAATWKPDTDAINSMHREFAAALREEITARPDAVIDGLRMAGARSEDAIWQVQPIVQLIAERNGEGMGEGIGGVGGPLHDTDTTSTLHVHNTDIDTETTLDVERYAHTHASTRTRGAQGPRPETVAASRKLK